MTDDTYEDTGRLDDDPAELDPIDASVADTVLAIRGLASEATPPTDLWPGIQARISANGRASGVTEDLGSSSRSWWSRSVSIPWAIAASVALASAIGVGTWQMANRGAAPQVASGETAPVTGAVRTVANPGGAELDVPDYDMAVAGLRQVYEEGKGQLAPETVEILEQSLAAIDTAIAEARAAIDADPARDEVRRVLYRNMNRKLDVLRQAAAAVQDRA